MRRQDHWRQQYQNDRYMQALSHDEIENRLKDIMSNQAILSEKGQISLHSPTDGGEYWIILFTHVLEELEMRSIPYSNVLRKGFLKDASLVKPTFPDEPKAKKRIDEIGGIKSNQLYKFGKHKWLKDAFRFGRFRIAPASLYKDPSLNKAIHDDELSFKINLRNSDFIIQNEQGEKTPTFGKIVYQLQSKTNYFVHCFAANYTYREFDDFDGDVCIVIKEQRKFIQKMMASVRKIKPDFNGFASGVRYIDPLNCNPDAVDIFFSKHFKYSYQNEYRTVWLPPDPIMELESFAIEIGSMESYAEYIRI
jgi:hypothetical protein